MLFKIGSLILNWIKIFEKCDSILYCKLSIWINVLIIKRVVKWLIKGVVFSLFKYLVCLMEVISVFGLVVCVLKVV